MLVMQLLFLWCSCALLLDLFFEKYPTIALFVLILFVSPFVQNVAGNIWKDLQMSLSWLLALSLMLHRYLLPRKTNAVVHVFVLLLIFYGMWVRLSGFPGAIPLLYFWWITTFDNQRFKSFLWASSGALILCFCGLQTEHLITKKLLKPHADHIEYKLILHDLTGLSLRTKELLFPELITRWPKFDTAYIFKKYEITTFDNIWWNSDQKKLFPGLNEDEHTQLRDYWRRTIMKHPNHYLRLKSEGFLYFLRMKDSGSDLMIMYPYIANNNFGFSYTFNRISQRLFSSIERRKDAFYMKPWFWCIVHVILMAFLLLPRLKNFRTLLLILNTSALFYLGIHFFVYPADTEFRYFYWYSLCLSLASLFTLAALLYPTRGANHKEV
jgi:hypothetical protein